MTRPLLAMFACYALGLVAGQNTASYENVAVVSCAPAPTITVADTEPAVEHTQTPLVERLLPKSEPPKPVIADGQLSPRGEWRWKMDQQAWVPVAKPGPRWLQDGHSATVDHLVREHGYKRADLVRLTQSQLDVLHSNSHNAARARRVSAPCPSGRCPRR